MKITLAGPAHAEVLAALHGEGFDDAWSVDAFSRALNSPDTFALMAQNEPDEPLGFVLIRSGGGEAEVLTILIRPSVRRSGLAKALMAEALNRLKVSAAQKIFLEVATDNPAAQALYARLNFAQVGRRKAYYRRGSGARVDALVLSLNLSL